MLDYLTPVERLPHAPIMDVDECTVLTVGDSYSLRCGMLVDFAPIFRWFYCNESGSPSVKYEDVGRDECPSIDNTTRWVFENGTEDYSQEGGCPYGQVAFTSRFGYDENFFCTGFFWRKGIVVG
jgi:hypothetical protein